MAVFPDFILSSTTAVRDHQPQRGDHRLKGGVDRRPPDPALPDGVSETGDRAGQVRFRQPLGVIDNRPRAARYPHPRPVR